MIEIDEMNAKYTQGRVGEGAGYLKPFLVKNITSIVVGTHLDGETSERAFKWYVEDKKWPLGL